MPKGIMVVHSSAADPSLDDEYNEWYSKTHMPDVLSVPGFVSCKRYKVPGAGPGEHTHVAIYEIDADSLDAPFNELRARTERGELKTSDLVGYDPPPDIRFYELTEESS